MKDKNQIIWVFGPSKAGKRTFIENLRKLKSSTLEKLQIIDNCYYSKLSINFVLPENQYERLKLPKEVSKETKNIFKKKKTFSYFLKGQQIDFENNTPQILRKKLPNFIHKVFFLHTNEKELLKRWTPQTFWGRKQNIESILRHITKQIYCTNLLKNDDFDVKFISADKEREYKIIRSKI